ncbi:MAG: hypothetical protein LBB90_04885 [Tannerella sp.]|jgi:hypothetical protein|nr:hypothetical protein [Tannerella sp.]
MSTTENNCLPAKNSSRQTTPTERNTVNQEYDFSKLNEFLIGTISINELVEDLQATLTSYIDLSIHALLIETGEKPVDVYAHKDLQHHIWTLSEVIKCLNQIKKTDKGV